VQSRNALEVVGVQLHDYVVIDRTCEALLKIMRLA